MSGSAPPLFLLRGCSRSPRACSLQRGLRHPAWPRESLPETGACYRALRRLPGRDFHPLAWSSLRGATREQYTSMLVSCTGAGNPRSPATWPTNGSDNVPSSRGRAPKIESLLPVPPKRPAAAGRFDLRPYRLLFPQSPADEAAYGSWSAGSAHAWVPCLRGLRGEREHSDAHRRLTPWRPGTR